MTSQEKKDTFKKSYYAIGDSIVSIQDTEMGDEATAILLRIRMDLEKLGKIANKKLGAWD